MAREVGPEDLAHTRSLGATSLARSDALLVRAPLPSPTPWLRVMPLGRPARSCKQQSYMHHNLPHRGERGKGKGERGKGKGERGNWVVLVFGECLEAEFL
jgi:hypothetical protein